MMASFQIYLAIGLPMFSILVVWLGSTLANNHAINGLGKRIDDLGNSLNKRIDDLDRGLNQRIDDLRSEMRTGFSAVNERLTRIEVRLDHVEDEVRKDHESRLSRLEAKVFTSAA
jgi:tetrahydromethanopterin S-methyltransferase subunit G